MQPESGSPSKSSSCEEDSNLEIHPLFMNGLPKNFDSHPGLKALANLSSSSSSSRKKESVAGGGKVKRKSSSLSPYRPYEKNKTTKDKVVHDNDNQGSPDDTNSGVSETSLFLKMWKLS